MPLDHVVALSCPVDVVILSYFAHNADIPKPLDPPQYTKQRMKSTGADADSLEVRTAIDQTPISRCRLVVRISTQVAMMI